MGDWVVTISGDNINKIKFFARNVFLSIFYLYLSSFSAANPWQIEKYSLPLSPNPVSPLAGWVGHDQWCKVNTMPSLLEHCWTAAHWCWKHIKDVTCDVYLRPSNLANLITHRRNGNSNVHVGCIIPIGLVHWRDNDSYSMSRRGLTALLILWEGNARAGTWGKQESTATHVFFVISNAKSGDAIGTHY